MKATRYEVRHYTRCQGWVNTWLEDDKPMTFATCEEAARELADFLADIRAEINSGERAADEGYDESEFQICAVHNEPKGATSCAL